MSKGQLFDWVVGSQSGRNTIFLVAVRNDVGVLHYQAFKPRVTRNDVAMFLINLSTILDDESATPPWTTPPPIVTCRLRHTDIPYTVPPDLLKIPQSYRILLFREEGKRKTAIGANPNPMHTY